MKKANVYVFEFFAQERNYRSLRAHYASAHWRTWFDAPPPPGENARRQRWKLQKWMWKWFYTWTDWPNSALSATCARRSYTGTTGRWWSTTPPSTTGWRRPSWTPSLPQFRRMSQKLFWSNFSPTSWFFCSRKVLPNCNMYSGWQCTS